MSVRTPPMRFALIVSVLALTIGSQATPQLSGLNLQLGDLIQSTRNQLRNTITQLRYPFQRNDYSQRRDHFFGQPHRPNNNYDRQMSRADQELWTQCSNLFAAHPPREWQHQNPGHTYNRFSPNLSPRPSDGFNGGWESQQRTSPPDHRLPEEPLRSPPRHPPSGPQPTRPQHHQADRDESGLVTVNDFPEELAETSTIAATVDVAPAELPSTDSTTASSVTDTIIQDNRNTATVTRAAVESPIITTTEFNWNDFYLGASADNTGGVGSIDVRGDFK